MRVSSADLARAMGVTPQAANQLVAGMEREGLVDREPHPTHKRVLETYPTDEGPRLVGSGRARSSSTAHKDEDGDGCTD